MKIAILGTGLVAQNIINYLKEDDTVELIDVYSRHQPTLKVGAASFKTLPYDSLNKSKYDVVFGALDAKLTRELYSKLNCSLFIDNSELFRLASGVPLVVGKLDDYELPICSIASNPNCVVTMVAELLIPLSRFFPLAKVIMTTMQSASGLGANGLTNLSKERSDFEYLDGELTPRFIQNGVLMPLFNNIIPFVGDLMKDGQTTEEAKIAAELKKLIDQDFEIAPSCYRVPLDYGHTASLHITLKDPVDINRIIRFIELNSSLVHQETGSLKAALDDPTSTFVTRIKADPFCHYAFMITMFSNNLTIGASYNSYMIYKKFLRRKHVL